MTKYARLTDELTIEIAQKNYVSQDVTILNFNTDVDLMKQYGFKPFIEAQREVGKNYEVTYQETDDEIREILTEIPPDPIEALRQAKEAKIIENDTKRDEALNQGVTYKDILFDSDTDQKVNLLATVSVMDDEQTIEWFGMNNNALECTKADLVAIGGLITQLHSFCWQKNYEIKTAINVAQTVAEVDEIEIEYGLEE